jgi:hypothetical protein
VAVATVVAACTGGCAHDTVLPDTASEPTCGNGVLEPGEECDVTSPGCVGCIVAPDWTCSANACAPVCGDGVLGDGNGCASPHRDTACDMSGWWAARESEYERDSVVGDVQSSSQWLLMHLDQSGDTFHVVDDLDCGVRVTGSATVEYTPASLRAVLYLNRMDGGGARRARTGTSRPSNGGCALTFERWYKIRGATDAYLPADFTADPPLKTLVPLPSESDPVNGTDFPPGATDPDGDGIPGIAFHVAGIFAGTRSSAQRDWEEYATGPGESVPAAGVELKVLGGFDEQESILRVTDCGDACALLDSRANVAHDIRNRMTLSFIGHTLGSDRVARVVTAPPRMQVDADLTTCANVRLVLPHDPSVPGP